MRRAGDFGDPFGELKSTGATVPAKDDIDMDRFVKALEVIEQRARRMNKAQLYNLQNRIGGAVRAFHVELLKYIHRPRVGQLQEFEKRRITNPMEDAGLDGGGQQEI